MRLITQAFDPARNAQHAFELKFSGLIFVLGLTVLLASCRTSAMVYMRKPADPSLVFLVDDDNYDAQSAKDDGAEPEKETLNP